MSGWRGLLAMIWLSAAAASCASPATTPEPPAAPPEEAPEPVEATSLRIGMEPLATVPNSGLQLPRISPDGGWAASLRLPRDIRTEPGAVLTGEGLGSVSLYLTGTAAEGDRRRIIVPGGACWPTWSDDGSRLACVAYDRSGRCQLIIHDVPTDRTRTLALGLDHMLSPAFSPSGRWLAVAAHEGDPAASRIHLIDLRTAAVRSGPPREQGEFHMKPLWLDEDHLLYIAGQSERVGVRRWQRGAAAGRPVRPLDITPASPMGVIQAFAGIAEPLNPDARRLAYYDAAANRIDIMDFDTGEEHALEEGTHAGCWVGPAQFAAADNRGLSLISMDSRSSRTLFEGPSLPRWAGRDADRLILCIPSSNIRNFQLLDLHWSGE